MQTRASSSALDHSAGGRPAKWGIRSSSASKPNDERAYRCCCARVSPTRAVSSCIDFAWSAASETTRRAIFHRARAFLAPAPPWASSVHSDSGLASVGSEVNGRTTREAVR